MILRFLKNPDHEVKEMWPETTHNTFWVCCMHFYNLFKTIVYMYGWGLLLIDSAIKLGNTMVQKGVKKQLPLSWLSKTNFFLLARMPFA